MNDNENQQFPELSNVIWRAIKDCADAQREAAVTARDMILNDINSDSDMNGKVQKYDIITHCDGKRITDLSQLQDIMFEKNQKSDHKDLRMLSFSYMADGRQQQLRMPLAMVVPTQFIQIKDVEIDFNINVHSYKKNLKVQIARRIDRPRINHNENTQTNESSIRINIKGRNIDMSSGMARVLQLASSIGTIVKPVVNSR